MRLWPDPATRRSIEYRLSLEEIRAVARLGASYLRRNGSTFDSVYVAGSQSPVSAHWPTRSSDLDLYFVIVKANPTFSVHKRLSRYLSTAFERTVQAHVVDHITHRQMQPPPRAAVYVR